MTAENKRYRGLSMADLFSTARNGRAGGDAAQPGPVDYADVAVGRDKTEACVKHGLYLLRDGERPLAVLVNGPVMFDGPPEISVEAMSPEPEAATAFFTTLSESMDRHNVYRGQVLTLGSPHGPFGHGGRMVEFPAFPQLRRESVVLPEGVLERVERHTVGFSKHAARLLAAGRHLKRGLLLYGPPGTGKTLTAIYLVSRMPGRTVLVLSGGG